MRDLVVLGAGMGGAITAWIGARLGLRVLLVEKGRHPRFAIGESSTPLSNLLLEQLADRYGLDGLGALARWGTWQREHPDLRVGRKRGFTFLHHPFDGARSDQLLVAASARPELADTHWMREDVDAWLVDQAIAAGVEYVDEAVVSDIAPPRLRLNGEPVDARLVVDATGQAAVVPRALGVPAVGFVDLPPRAAIYGHVTGARRIADLHSFDGAPYPPDEAALHHLVGDAWVWVLRFDDGRASVGAVLPAASSWDDVLDRSPTLRAQLGDASFVTPIHRATIGHRFARGAGPGWVALPQSAAFVDPMLSTGFALTLGAVTRLAGLLEDGLDGIDAPLAAGAASDLADADALATLVAALMASSRDPEVFRGLALLYFAGITQAETRGRLGRPVRFMHLDHPVFGPAVLRLARAAAAGTMDRAELLAGLAQTIAPLDVAGFSDPERAPYYPVLLDDLLDHADRVDSTPPELRAMLARWGLATSPAGAC